ncbi:MAG: putative baseplate assembly protein [Acidobacteria bacterium 13_2_20CM_57_17]|nr:MAG: putative baseplate assembly protein [Acidobacteria bacterium 13_2_20CM_57_17]OLB95618.1 MAG: putative baseplate assembly protein [Acidobacteria bacterium 13_2_20CM_2_57_12]OLE16054.1 MAG: putative baseplate assembly protein [Acidobacteria bacterium 13_1_20CM_4_57_11]
MPLQAPILDDRTFDQIVSQAKLLIPRYAPAWTNQSEADPGITLTELFAWMTEMILYRLNQVPDLNYIKFLQLLGIELNSAQPARADITFTLTSSLVPTVIVPAGTQVAAGGSPPIVFETDESLVVLGAKLKALQNFDGFAYDVVTTANGAKGQWYYPFGPNAREGAALMLGFDAPSGFTTGQINLAVYVYTEGLAPEGHNCDLDLNVLPVASTFVLEFWDGRYWNAIAMDKDDSRAFTRSGHMYFPAPGSSIKKDVLGNVKDSLYWFRIRLQKNGYDMTPRLSAVITNTVSATQGQTIRDEIVGGSNGRPNQTFRLANAPVIKIPTPYTVTGSGGLKVQVTTVQLELDEGAGFLAWQQVDDFFASGPDDPHFTIDRTTGQITFGDGQFGRIPVANPAEPNTNIFARFYRFGGGAVGNVGAGSVQTLQTFVSGIDSATNLQSAIGGSDEETLDSAKLRAPQQLKSKNRAVTAEDFEYTAEQTPGVRVRRAKALPLVHPKYYGTPIPGVVTVIVVPESDAPNPIPGAATLAIVCAELNQHRLLTSEVFVVAPTYRLVRIEANVVVAPNADLSEVKKGVEQALTRWFHPLTGADGQGWPFGGTIFYSDVYRVILSVAGVSRLQDNQLVIWLDNERQPFCRDVPISTGELLYALGHQISVTY